MNMLQSALIIAGAALLVLAFCSGIKAACRKILSKLEVENKSKAGES